MTASLQERLVRIDEYRWEIPVDYKPGMRVPGLVYADDRLMKQIKEERALEQVANVAFLPGIVWRSLAMPDIHWGYGFPIGGVAATRVEDGVISPGGIGFDINCGVRLLRTDLTEKEVRPRLPDLIQELFRAVPSGVGAEGRIRLGSLELDGVLKMGARWAVEAGYGTPADLEASEEQGELASADPSKVSERARKRGSPQLGTLGSGNHFLEIQEVEEIFDPTLASGMGIDSVGQVTVMIHCGSRGLGHQVCEEHLRVMVAAGKKYGIEVPDRQLACAPVRSPEGQDYLAAMAASANFAWANRQCIAHWTREAFHRVFRASPEALGMEQVYDVAHNVAKTEEYEIDGARRMLCIHRKGATRAFPPGHPDLPARYRSVGQPVLIPGDMGRYSYLAAGTQRAMEESFGSTCHGAGRVMSRGEAKRTMSAQQLLSQLAAGGVQVQTADRGTLVEEAPQAYKDVEEVVHVVAGAGLVKKVARMRPMGVVKG
ncbi:MAG TPA: RtcB family protein [Chloroflexota bacterium]|nr:RtcB family protein [Chloroflexota bacterium]